MINAELKVGILVLAAGESSRLGQAKQLVKFRQKTLIEHTIDICIESQLGPVHVVLGSRANSIRTIIEKKDIYIHVNNNWKYGMGSSIAYGFKNMRDVKLRGVIVCLVDQVFITADLLRQIAEIARKEMYPIVVSNFGKNDGPPCYFDQCYFNELQKLKGEKGAKSIIRDYMDRVKKVEFTLGEIDLDTPNDLLRLRLLE